MVHSSCSNKGLPSPPSKVIAREQPFHSTPKSSLSTVQQKTRDLPTRSRPPKQRSRTSRSRSRSSRSSRRSRSINLDLSTPQSQKSSLGRSRSPSRSLSGRSSSTESSHSTWRSGSQSGKDATTNRRVGDVSREEASQSRSSSSIVDISKTGSRSSNQKDQSSNTFPMPEGRFQKRVLHLLTEIRNTLQQVGKRCEPEESDFHLSQATSQDQLQALENSLRDTETKRMLVSRVAKVGGSSLKDNIRNVMNRIMSNEVMSAMNMDGNGGKIAFRKTAVFKIITESVLKNHKGTENDVAQAVSRLLKYAPGRRGGGGRKEN